MYALVYVSSESFRISDQDLEELLRQSRRNSQAADITGLLLFKDGNFMQLLEGTETAVRTAFEKIKVDHRHRSVRVLMEEETDRREFADWSMGFQKLTNHTLLEVDGCRIVFPEPKTAPQVRSGESDFLTIRSLAGDASKPCFAG